MKLSPWPFTLRQLQYVVAVAETLSFRAAAERCHVAQPSLSAQLAQLEKALGVRLFERDRRRVLLTVAGRALLERARAELRETGDLVEAATRAGDPLNGCRSASSPPSRRTCCRRRRPRCAGLIRASSCADADRRAARRAGAPPRRRALLPRSGAGGVRAHRRVRERVPRHQSLHARPDGGRRRRRHAAARACGRHGDGPHAAARAAPGRSHAAADDRAGVARGYPLAAALRDVAGTIKDAYPASQRSL